MRRLWAALAAAVTAVALVGCAPAMESGVVVDKSYRAGYYDQYCAAYKTDGTCQTWMPRWNPPDHYLRIDGVDAERELVTRTIHVYESVWNSCEVGDQWTREGGCT